MTSQWTRLAVAVWITAFGLWIPASAPAGEFPQPRSGYQAPDARWRLNPAGQLELTFDPLNNGQSEYGETYTVILNDRAPKMCGDPDGTGRHEPHGSGHGHQCRGGEPDRPANGNRARRADLENPQ